jgi:FAD/FMN-containing dehydrogenase
MDMCDATELIEHARRELPDTCQILAGLEAREYARAWSGEGSSPAFVVQPQRIDDVVGVVRWANRHCMPLIPCGGRTGLSGGVHAEGEMLLGLGRLRVEPQFNPVDRTITVQAGTTTQEVQLAAERAGLFYPVDFASRGSSQIGGNIATNAGGIRVLRYGLTRNWVAGLKVVTGAGDLLDLNKGLVKNATGYDFRHLFIGSEGTLGVVVEATLQLIDKPPPQQVMVLGLTSLDAVMEVFRKLRSRLRLSAFEFFTETALKFVVGNGRRRPFGVSPYYVLAEFDADDAAASSSFDACFASGLVEDGVVSQSEAQSIELWRLREEITASISGRRPYKNDISVRVSQVPAFLAEIDSLLSRAYPDFEVVWFGHVGDGNLHINVLPPESLSSGEFSNVCGGVTHMIGEVLAGYGGSISAEHGVGLLKRDYLHYTRSHAEIELMRQLKRVFDPTGILNPGKLL